MALLFELLLMSEFTGVNKIINRNCYYKISSDVSLMTYTKRRVYEVPK